MLSHYTFLAAIISYSSFLLLPTRSELDNYCVDSVDPFEYGVDLGNIEFDGDELRFLTVGDWGIVGCDADDCNPNITHMMSNSMNNYAEYFDPSFIISVGDGFYQSGIDDVNDSRWDVTYESIFYGDKLENIYFYATLGNHDWDPNRFNYQDGFDEETWDDGTNAQIEYTTSSNNFFKRWCLPSYYYTFSYTMNDDKFRFIAFDTLSLQRCTVGSTSSYCQGESTPPNPADFWSWFDALLQSSYDAREHVIVFTHYALVSNGNYGLENVNNSKCRGNTAGDEVLRNITEVLVIYDNIKLYIAGHEHNSNLFYGTSRIDDDDEYIHLLTGSYGKTNGHVCGDQDDIEQQYENSSIDWNMVYGTTDPGFGAVTINATHINVEMIGYESEMLAEYAIPFGSGSSTVETTEEESPDSANNLLINNSFLCVLFLISFLY